MNVLFFAVQITLWSLIPLALQLLDRRRLTAEQREWVWEYASWGSAVYNFGALSLVAWGYHTRSPHYGRGLAAGVGLTGVALIVQGILCEGIGRALGLRESVLADARAGLIGSMGAAVVLALVIGAGRAIYEAVRSSDAVARDPVSFR